MKVNILFEHHQDYDPETVANHIKATVLGEGTPVSSDTVAENLPKEDSEISKASSPEVKSFMKLHQSHEAPQGKSLSLHHTSSDVEFKYTFSRHKTRLEISGRSIPKAMVKEAVSHLTDNFVMKKAKVTYQ